MTIGIGDMMNSYYLDVPNDNIGAYFSSEQLDLLSIIQCRSHQELIQFIMECAQLKGVYQEDKMKEFYERDLDEVKKEVFASYQKTLVPHDSTRETVLNNTLEHLSLKQEDIDAIHDASKNKQIPSIKDYAEEYIRSHYPERYREIFRQFQRFVSIERDQNKMDILYEELSLVNSKLSSFNTLLLGSGRPEMVINEFLIGDKEHQFDYYFAMRDFDFAYRNNKHVRFHSLLTKWSCEHFFQGKSKEEICQILKEYVKATIDFVNEYNRTHRLPDGTPVIQAIDLLNELVSFDENAQGEYENIWETNYGISISDICEIFEYAKSHKPQGVSYLYNEPFLENSKRRKKVLEVLQSINATSNGLIDTLGSQTHITFTTEEANIQKCFQDFKTLQDTQGMNIQITEFDLSLGENEILNLMNNPSLSITYEELYNMKKKKMDQISSIVRESGVLLQGISYWSLTDHIDCNLERIRSKFLERGMLDKEHLDQFSTVCGGLIPTALMIPVKEIMQEKVDAPKSM